MRRSLPGLGLWLCLALCAWVYWPGLAGPFLLDDRINLQGLDILQDGASFTPDVVRENASGPLGRPVSMLSFAGSWFASGGLDPQVFKQHNLALHLLAGSLVCWLVFLLLSALRVPDCELIAVMTAGVWLLSPLMLSTVLYVIQRMAQLACVFTLLALICFCKARLAEAAIPRWALAVTSGLFAFAAILSKETALVVLPLLLLLEYGVFRPVQPSRTYGLVEKSVVVLLVGVSAVVLIASGAGWLSDGLLSYANRDFTLGERVMTQFRVLLDYVAGLFWPLKGGYGLYHDDFQISRGWLSPPATLVAGLAVSVVFVMAVIGLVYNRSRVLALGILFFFLAHSTESTIFPLEIYFEHRNYLPAVGLCMGLGWGVVRLARRLPETRALAIIAYAAFILVSAVATGLRASYWSSVELYSALAVTEHPESPRANIAYGTALARAGDPALGSGYIRKAGRQLDDPAVVTPLREIWLYCVAGMAPPESLFQQLDAQMGGFGNTRIDEALDAVVQAVLDGQCTPVVGVELADSILGFRDSGGRLTVRASGLAVKLENDLERFGNALRYADDMLLRDPRSVVANLMVAYLAERVGDTAKRDRAIVQLRVLDCAGQLSLDQQQSLAALAGQPEGDACDARH